MDISQPEVIYEDRVILVLNKPAGLTVNRSGTSGETLQDWIDQKFRYGGGDEFARRSGVVHRLDKETSGVMVIAKTRKAFENIKLQFKNRQVKKVYWGLVYGKLEPRAGAIGVPIGRSALNREKFMVRSEGKYAETEYQVRGIYQDDRAKIYSLVELKPKTGRTHQLRVHLAYLGHPIVGDERYTGDKQRKLGREIWGRQWLHAVSLALNHPQTLRQMKWKIRIPATLELGLKKLRRVG